MISAETAEKSEIGSQAYDVLPGKYGNPKPPVPGGDPPIVDIGLALKFCGEECILKEVVAIFMEQDYPEQIKQLKDGIDRNDAQAVKRASHTLKGVVRCLGSDKLGDTAWRLEEMGRNNDLTGARAALQQLERQLNQLAVFFNNYHWTLAS